LRWNAEHGGGQSRLLAQYRESILSLVLVRLRGDPMMMRFFVAIVAAWTTIASAAPTINGCPALPADNIWNARVDTLPVHPSSATWISTIGSTRAFHMD